MCKLKIKHWFHQQFILVCIEHYLFNDYDVITKLKTIAEEIYYLFSFVASDSTIHELSVYNSIEPLCYIVPINVHDSYTFFLFIVNGDCTDQDKTSLQHGYFPILFSRCF